MNMPVLQIQSEKKEGYSNSNSKSSKYADKRKVQTSKKFKGKKRMQRENEELEWSAYQ